MKATSKKMAGSDRRAAIIAAARQVFVGKGFYRTTTRELAAAAGVSEALLFKHFPSKDALYAAILKSCFSEEESKIEKQLRTLEPSTSGLVFLVTDLVIHVLGTQAEADARLFFRLILRSLMDEGEFTRLAIQGGPFHWVKKVEECLRAARRAGDMIAPPPRPSLAGWMVHQLVSGIMLHSLPSQPVVDYGVSHEELVKQVVWFCLRGMGVKDDVIRRCCKPEKLREQLSTARAEIRGRQAISRGLER
ncbi:MAG: TetR/AcrR family transcriptional regulator [Planctomycetaceae bacterium]|nr:TetR/AcrR family transcriptional regulator [Planctomycetaceae bacterium]